MVGVRGNPGDPLGQDSMSARVRHDKYGRHEGIPPNTFTKESINKSFIYTGITEMLKSTIGAKIPRKRGTHQ